jgi:hypothetical protein
MDFPIDRFQCGAIQIGPAYFFVLVGEGEVGDGLTVGLHHFDELFGGRVELIEQVEAVMLIGKGDGWLLVHLFEEGHDAVHEVLPLVLVDVYGSGVGYPYRIVQILEE